MSIQENEKTTNIVVVSFSKGEVMRNYFLDWYQSSILSARGSQSYQNPVAVIVIFIAASLVPQHALRRGEDVLVGDDGATADIQVDSIW